MLATFQAIASDFRLNHSDLSVMINMSKIENATARMSNTYYSGKYITGRKVCASPRLTLNTTTIAINTQGNLTGNQGKAVLTTAGKMGVNARLTRCGSWSVGAACRVTNNLSDLTKASRIGGLCVARFGPFRFPFFVGSEIEPIIKAPPIFPITLTDTESLSMEFGSWDGSSWEPSTDPKNKVVSYKAKLGVKTTANPVPPGRISGEVLSMDASVGEQYFNTTKDRRQYRQHYLHAANFDTGKDLFQLNLDQSLFLKTDSGGNSSGIFGEIFPIRMQGEIEGEELDIILEGGSVKFGSIEDEKVIQIGAKVVSVSTGAFIEDAEALVTLSQPEFESNELVTYIKSFELNMTTKCLLLSFCLKASLLDHIGDTRLVITKLDGELELEVPNCIMMGKDWEPDGGICPLETMGRRDNVAKSTRLTPLYDQARVDISEYAIHITIPAKETLYNPENIVSAQSLTNKEFENSKSLVIPDESLIQGTERDDAQ